MTVKPDNYRFFRKTVSVIVLGLTLVLRSHLYNRNTHAARSVLGDRNPTDLTGTFVAGDTTLNSEKPRGHFSSTKYPRPRWNVLDMINYIGANQVPTYLWADIDMTWAETFRQRLKEMGVKTTVTAILLKAIGIAQRAHPASRTEIYPWGKTVTFNDIVAGFTVERLVGSQPAVFFGAIHAPDTKTVEEIALELKEYGTADFAKVEQLDVQNRFNNMPWLFRRFILWMGLTFPGFRLRYMGATFGISSLGKFGVKSLIPPCVSTSTFGVGSVEERAVVRDGQIVIRPMMTISLNFDHRAIDGAPAARFLQDIIALMEGGLENYVHNSASGEKAASPPTITPSKSYS